ncbi:hypothetical protein GH714_029198 [Hevea brasiliensis]|uniref:Uncharacterized protein n=1 Tax=Hevea brasiliensis TaxID=3981 RepID=A0A6A6KL29_HEVBR|nr:hypothetical protein GH714_029198 [Hevea brasiliensis]
MKDRLNSAPHLKELDPNAKPPKLSQKESLENIADIEECRAASSRRAKSVCCAGRRSHSSSHATLEHLQLFYSSKDCIDSNGRKMGSISRLFQLQVS